MAGASQLVWVITGDGVTGEAGRGVQCEVLVGVMMSDVRQAVCMLTMLTV